MLAHLSSEVTSQLPNAKQADSEGEQVAGERFHGVLMMIVISCRGGSDGLKRHGIGLAFLHLDRVGLCGVKTTGQVPNKILLIDAGTVTHCTKQSV